MDSVEKTLLKKKKTNSPNALSQNAIASISATGVSAILSVTSPIAQTPGAVVLEKASTLMAPVLASSSTPDFSSPRLWELGLRPVPNITRAAPSMTPGLPSGLV